MVIAGVAQHPLAYATLQLMAADAGRLVLVAAGLQFVAGLFWQSVAGAPSTTLVTTG